MFKRSEACELNASATVTVRRTASHDVRERELYVSIDGSPNEILQFGDSVSIPVSPGHHRIRVHNTLSRRVAEFDVTPGEEVRFSAVNVRGKGFLWMAAFFGFALMYTELEREAARPSNQGPGEQVC